VEVVVDEERCCGAGNCVLVAPGIFEQRPDTGVVTLRHETVSAESLPLLREAVVLCPVGAIMLVGR
jgi:ferredoxin